MIILSPQVIRDRDTGISRGFAFITFHCESTVEALLMQTPHQPQHCIEGKTIRIAAVNQAKGTEAKKKWVSWNALGLGFIYPPFFQAQPGRQQPLPPLP